MTRRSSREGSCLVRKIECKIVKDALDNEEQILAMNEEIDHIEKNKTRSPVLRFEGKNVIGKKWIFRKKHYENGEVKRNKAILVCKGYAQEEGIDYGETFASIARLGV